MKRLTTLLFVAILLVGAVAPVAAAGAGASGQVDECKNAEKGPNGDGGPPSFVGNLVPDFLGDLFASLPVPGFLKSLVGAGSC